MAVKVLGHLTTHSINTKHIKMPAIVLGATNTTKEKACSLPSWHSLFLIMFLYTIPEYMMKTINLQDNSTES